MWWITASVRCFKSKIQDFLELEKKFADLTLLGKHKDAGQVLDEIEMRLGTSLWLLEARIANLELQGGVKDQKDYTKSITEDDSISSATRTIAYYTSYRTESTVTADRYFDTVLKAFDESEDGEYTATPYFLFRLAFFSKLSFLKIKSILVFEGCAALIDRYLTIVRIIQLIFADSRHANLRACAQNVAVHLSQSVNDSRLESILRFRSLSDAEPTPQCDLFLSILDSYTQGKYDEVLIIPAAQHDSSNRIAASEIRAKALIRSIGAPAAKTSGVALDIERIESVLCTALAKGPDCLESHSALLKLLLLFPQSNWAADLFGCLSREFRQISEDRRGRYSLFGQFNGSSVSPRLFASNPLTPKWITSRKIGEGGLTYKLLHAVESGKPDALREFQEQVPEKRLAKYEAIALLKCNRASEAAPHLVKLLGSPIPLDREDAIEGLVRALLTTGQPVAAFEQIVLDLTENPGFMTRIDVDGLWNFARDNFRAGRPLEHSIAVPVLCDIVSGRVDSVTDGERTSLLEDYLHRTGHRRPSHLTPPESKIGELLLVHLLRHLAVPTTLDSHIEYESSQDVEDERIAVCQNLTKLDPIRSVNYSEEIARITRAQLIQRGVRQVEKSKIYVDIAGLRNNLRNSVKDLFERYQSLPITKGLEVTDLLLQIGSQLEKRGMKLLVSLPRNERLAAFNELFLAIRDRFVSSSEHGLDVYLSVGIRHGTLAGQLRSVFERESLLGRRSADGSFSTPIKWATLFGGNEDASALEILSREIESFTDGVDSLIKELRDKYIQINTESRPTEGWFDYKFTNQELLTIESKSQDVESFDAFCDLVMDVLWQRTERNLATVRSSLTGAIRNSFSSLLDKLSDASGTLPPAHDRMQYQAAITRVRPLMQTELASIAAWFTRHGAGDADPYRIDTAIDIARTMFERCNPGRTLRIDVRVDGDARTLNGRTLPGMVDIFYLLLDNVGKYGKEVAASELQCELQCKITAKALEVVLENPVDQDLSREKKSQVDAILRDIESETAHERAKREGGTGLLKLAKIIRIDFGSTLQFSAAYPKKNLFRVSFGAVDGRPFS
ncbi:hypothetical protein [Curvibacter sp. PAE-UM]|uniref:hypothetical protein n=1 Tax=Curvibacter sp. PAE-UM TaxID=1714344 RepID=UPI0012E336AA|nr:hypothetical protein [Curvibacter sp. PAE-UM]